MRLDFAVSPFKDVTDSIAADAAKAVTAAMDDVTQGLKSDLRAEALVLGSKFANTWQGRRYPRGGNSVEAAAFVWSKAANLADAFDKGVTIRSQNGYFLAIPTPAAGARGLGIGGKSQRISPGAWERRTGMRLRFVYRRGGYSLLVADDTMLRKSGVATSGITRRGGAQFVRIAGRQTVVMFILVPQVKMPKLLDIAPVADAWADKVGSLISEHWN